MDPRNRRQFLADVGRGMMIASVGYATAFDLGLTRALADDGTDKLDFGDLEPLVCLMQETPDDRLLPLLVARLESGTDLRDLVEAAALANARTFGGEDYIGFHTMMALAPAYAMARELPVERQPLPVLKVLFRNTRRIREFGGRSKEVLRPVSPGSLPPGRDGGEALRDAVRRNDAEESERIFAALAKVSSDAAFNGLLFVIQDNTEVHRVVLPYRAWDMAHLIGMENAGTLLRQSLRFCLSAERRERTAERDEPRTVLPKLFDRYKLEGRPPGKRAADDSFVEGLAQSIFQATAAQAAEAAAAALADGFAPDVVGEAISLAANQLVLRDRGRSPGQEQPYKPLGSVHGDSIGVHACDSANAWRNMARVANPRNAVACLILGAYQVAYDRVNRGGQFLEWQPLPAPLDVDGIRTTEPAALLAEADEAIRANGQARAAAVVHRYGALGHPPRPVFDLLLRFATSEDGALHAEKYYRTASEEFAATRPAFRWRQLVALARVTASEFGKRAAGYDEACRLLGLPVSSG